MMKKMTALLLSVLLCTGLFAGCSSGSTTSGGGESSQTTEPADAGSADTTDEPAQEGDSAGGETAPAEDPYPTLENGSITILWHTTEETYQENLATNPDTFDAVWSVKEAFEQKYGGTVTVNAVPWGDMKSTLISMVSTGEVCDLAQANDQSFPIYPVKKLIQPIADYIDLSNPLWYDSVTEAFTFSGIPYAAGTDATSILIYYNKTLLDSYGVKTPEEYYAEGNWNWDAFREIGMEVTGDTDGDGVNDQFGFGWWDGDYKLFIASNGATDMVYGDDGSISASYNSPETIAALQFLQDAYVKDAYIDATKEGDYFLNEFRSGKLAMTCEYGMLNFSDVDFELGCIPFPKGPSGTQDAGLGGMSGWSIPVTAANGEGAAAFAYMSSQMTKASIEKNIGSKFSQEEVERYLNAVNLIRFAPIGVGDQYWDANWAIHSGLIDGTPVATFTATAQDAITKAVKATMEQ